MALAPQAYLARLIALLAAWRRNATETRCLAEMSDYNLKDIGLSRDAGTRETTTLLWRR